VLVNGRTAREVVVRECHISRVEIASIPTWQSLNDPKTACIHKGHGKFLLAYCNKLPSARIVRKVGSRAIAENRLEYPS
jgi:hypothetical protein